MVHFFSGIETLNIHLGNIQARYSGVFVLVDENTREYCFPLVSSVLNQVKIIEISSGEVNKTLGSCEQIWKALTEAQADRKSVLVNLGGGVITDMGGFAASCFKRGIDFINIPTTLLAMVDASVGGKTGIDFHTFKNQIGVFNEAKEVLICNEFLKTLDDRQLVSGLAEVLKHYLIADGEAFLSFTKRNVLTQSEIIRKAVAIKSGIVEADPFEANIRKKLNFGHSVGHALESHRLGSAEELLHGEAVAYGMMIETCIAVQKSMLTIDNARQVFTTLRSVFELQTLSDDDIEAVLSNVNQDKKNDNGVVRMALINDIGSCLTDIAVTTDEIRGAIDQFNQSVRTAAI